MREQTRKMLNKNKWIWDFPSGTVVKNLPANAGDTVSSPGLGRSHMPRNNWAHAPQLLKPACLKPVHRNEKAAHRKEEKPPLATTRESAHAAKKTQRSQKKKSESTMVNIHLC